MQERCLGALCFFFALPFWLLGVGWQSSFFIMLHFHIPPTVSRSVIDVFLPRGGGSGKGELCQEIYYGTIRFKLCFGSGE